MTDIILDEEDFDDFVNEILRNPIDDNENLRDLLDRPSRWSNDSDEESDAGLEKETPL